MTENKDVVSKLAERYEVKKVVVFVYHSQANEMIEHDHKPIVNALSKMST